jgi:long-chain acyl-CoA synthetase
MNIASVLTKNADKYASKPITIFKDQPQSHDEFVSQVTVIRADLQTLGIEKGSIVAVLAFNGPAWLASFFAVASLGAIAVPINPGLAVPEVHTIIEHCQPSVLVVQPELADTLDEKSLSGTALYVLHASCSESSPRIVEASVLQNEVCEIAAGDTAMIIYSSGTTGKPKGIVLSHGAIQFSTEMFATQLCMSPDDRTLVTGPLAFFYHGVMNAIGALTKASTVVLLEKFHPELAIRAIEKHKITVMMAVPTAYGMMLNWMGGRQFDFSSLRVALSAGAVFSEALYERAKAGFGIAVFDCLGMTECAPTTTYDPKIDKEARAGSCGRVLPGCEIRIVDERLRDLEPGQTGQLLVRSPAMMDGYYKNAAATSETIVDGWVCSGDLGRFDAEGFLYIVGRQKEMIIRGGANIYPADIEDVLYRYESVAECAVIGVPDQMYGEIVKAFVVLKEGFSTTESDLLEHCRRQIAEYKTPSEIRIVESLPKSATGKILRRVLQESLA